MNEQLQSPLFGLPPELRQLIYYYALTSSTAIMDSAKFRNDKDKNNWTPVIAWKYPLLGLSLPQTCRRIHRELDIEPFYANNRFSFTLPNAAHDFLKSLYSIKRIHLLSELAFDMRYVTNLPEPGDPLREDGGGTARWRNPLLLPGPPPGNINPRQGWDIPTGSEFVEWEHYLSCLAPTEAEYMGCGFTCRTGWFEPNLVQEHPFWGDDHFIEACAELDRLNVMVVDFVEMQRNILRAGGEGVVEGGFVRVLDVFVDVLLFLVETGVEIRVRMLDSRGEVVERMLCAAGYEDKSLAILEGGEESSTAKEWTRKGLRTMLDRFYGNQSDESGCGR